MRLTKPKVHFIITLLWMAFIFLQSALPGKTSGAESGIIVDFIRRFIEVDPAMLSWFIRKGAHFTEYAILGGLLTVNVSERLPWRGLSARRVGLTWLLGTLYAISDEIHQYFVPERACAVMDMCIDSAGVLTGVILARLILQRLLRRNEHEI